MAIPKLAFPFPLSDETQAEVDRIESDALALESDSEDLRQKTAELAAVTPQDWTPQHDAAATQQRAKRAETLNREIGIRQRIRNVLAQVRAVDQRGAMNAAYQEHMTAKATTIGVIQSIGYNLGPVNPNHNSVDGPDNYLILRHPSVVQAGRKSDTYLKFDVAGQRDTNEAEIEKLTTKLGAMRTAVLAPLS